MNRFLLKPILLNILLSITFFINAQVKPIEKLSAVTVNDFNIKSAVVDENANAVILADIGTSYFEGNNNGRIDIIFNEHKRILIKNKVAFDIASISIPIYFGKTFDDEESFYDFEATTYNLENGVIKETKLDKSSVYKEKYNKYYNVRKFTFPNLKEGSIIEYKYTIKSPFWDELRSWRFQADYPVLWSQYQVTIPPMFNYYSKRKGYLKFAMDSVKNVFKTYSIVDPGKAGDASSFYHLSGNAVWALWIMKDAPAFKKEKYTSTSKNYLSELSFQLNTINYSEDNIKHVLKSWFEKSKDILKEDYIADVYKDNHWLNDDLKSLLNGMHNPEDKAKKIYEYVRDNYASTGTLTITPSQTIKKTYQTKSGNVADINLLLIAMLYNQGINADPLILSTRNNGKVLESMPLLEEYNYMMTRVVIDTATSYILDATHNRLGFGVVPKECLNGSGRVINAKTPILVPLLPDDVSETKSTAIYIYNDSIKGSSSCTYNTLLGTYESLDYRETLETSKREDFVKAIKKGYTSDIEISDVTLDSLKQYEQPLAINYNLKIKWADDDVIYFNPLFNEATKYNPFAAAERLYPIEMPFKPNETYTLVMEIPTGYKVDELPKSTRVKLNENEGMFEYIATSDANTIQLRYKLVLNKATFNPEDYATLRDFYGYVVKKQAEQIVFKKIK